MLAWLLLVAPAAASAGGCGCDRCLAVHPLVLGKTGTEPVCTGAEEKCDASCARCTARGDVCEAPAFLEVRAGSQMGCPPPQACTCNCNCPELVYPVPPPMPLLPTPSPHFGLTQTGAKMQLAPAVPAFVQTAAATSVVQPGVAMAFVQTGVAKQPVPGTALPRPGAAINLLPPPPMPPLPPMPPDPRIQECPINTPCTCYCHCRRPPQTPTAELFAPPLAPR